MAADGNSALADALSRQATSITASQRMRREEKQLNRVFWRERLDITVIVLCTSLLMRLESHE